MSLVPSYSVVLAWRQPAAEADVLSRPAALTTCGFLVIASVQLCQRVTSGAVAEVGWLAMVGAGSGRCMQLASMEHRHSHANIHPAVRGHAARHRMVQFQAGRSPLLWQ